MRTVHWKTCMAIGLLTLGLGTSMVTSPVEAINGTAEVSAGMDVDG